MLGLEKYCNYYVLEKIILFCSSGKGRWSHVMGVIFLNTPDCSKIEHTDKPFINIGIACIDYLYRAVR